MATTIVTKSGSGAPTASDLVAGELAVDLTNGRLYTEDSGGTVLELGTNPSGDVTFADNGKAIFGAGDALQIYHNANTSFITESGSSNFKIGGENLYLQNTAHNENYLAAIANQGVTLYYNNAPKIATSATGIDITGTATMDGLTVDGDSITANAQNAVTIEYSGAEGVISADRTGGNFGELFFKTTAGAAPLSRIKIAYNGDISFYEDTGTTPKFFWDASAERLGIGTSSPSVNTEIRGSASNGQLRLGGSTTATYANIYSDNDGVLVLGADAGNNAANSYFGVEVDGSERFRIDSSGLVGIGSSTMSSYNTNFNDLVVDGGTSSGVTIVSGTSGDGTIAFADGTTGDEQYRGYVQYTHAGDTLKFGSGGTLAMTIDASNNLLVGTTSQISSGKLSVAGGASANGITATTSATVGYAAASFQRTASDGELIGFKQGATTVGSIGSTGGVIYFAGPNSSTGGFRIDSIGTNGVIVPTTNTGANRDAATDLGYSSGGTNIRFRDLYLSGGVVFGDAGGSGTSTSNTLDSYEEGTWTPIISGASVAGAGTYTIQSGKYVIVGQMVYVSARLGWSAHTGSGNMILAGLPYTANIEYANLGVVFRDGLTVSSGHTVNAGVVPNTNYANILEISTGTDNASTIALDTAVADLAISGWYQIA